MKQLINSCLTLFLLFLKCLIVLFTDGEDILKIGSD